MTIITRSILSEYRLQHAIYKDFCSLVVVLLEDLLKKGKYKYHLSSRVKEEASIIEKIKRKKSEGKDYKHLEDIDDIAGVRVVFYTEIDKKKFVRTLKKEFGSSAEIYEAKGKHGYSSTHILATLGETRSELSEYKKFKNLICEIQLTLILDHAWAEVEHDVLYKTSSKIKKLDSMYYENLKIRMENIMSQHLKQASIELESILSEVKKIKSSKR